MEMKCLMKKFKKKLSTYQNILYIWVLITANIPSIGEVQTKDAEPERFKSVANKAQCDN